MLKGEEWRGVLSAYTNLKKLMKLSYYKSITRATEEHFIMIEGSVNQGNITFWF